MKRQNCTLQLNEVYFIHGNWTMTLDLKKFTKPGFKQRQFYFFNACDTRYGTKLLVSVIKAKFAINYIME